MTGLLRVRLGGQELSGGGSDLNDIHRACGDDLAWGIAVPWTFRALHVPRVCAVMPAAPVAGDDIDSATVYWGALMHLIDFRLAWTRPYRGLRWWYDAGKPVDDSCLALIADIWDADGQLDWFTAWMAKQDPDQSPMFDGIIDPGYVSQQPIVRPNIEAAWVEAVQESAEYAGHPTPLTTGSDPLHLLGHHGSALSESSDGSTQLHSSPHGRSAVLIMNTMNGWYRQLAIKGATLPPLGNRSWHVDVFVKTAGYLGTYRRSRMTGLWFSGQHSLHMRGN